MSYTPKKFYYKVYTSAGVYITTWSSDVTNEPAFRMILNSGQSEMKIRLARTFGSYGEDSDVKFNNEVRVYIVDKEAPNGLLIYSGYISDYQPSLDNSDEYVEITTLGYVVELENTVFINTDGNTAKVYLSQDPKDIIADILTLYAGKVTAGSMDATGVSRDYTFNNITNQQAIDKARELCPAGWWWYVDEQKHLNLHAKSVTATHTFIVGKHLTKIEGFKTVRDLKNAVRFIGGVPSGGAQLYKVYTDPTSIGLYGRKEYVMIDTRVITTATADAMVQAYLDTNKNPFVRATVDILDSNGDDQALGYDIDSIKPGDTCKVIDPKFPAGAQTYALNQVMIIQSVQYDYDKVTLELSIRPPWVAKRIQDIYKDLNRSVLSDVPVYPSNAVGVTLGDLFGNVTYGDVSQPNSLSVLKGKVNVYDNAGVQTIQAGRIQTAGVDFVVIGTNNIVGTINASVEGITISAAKISISGSTTFTSGYDPSQKISDSTYGVGGKYASAASGARVLIFPDANTGIQVIDNASNDVFKCIVGGTDVGDVIIGNFASNQGAKYDKSASTFVVRGSLNADDISAGTLTGRIVRTSAGTTRIELNSTDNSLYSYLGGYLRVELAEDYLIFYNATFSGISGGLAAVDTDVFAIRSGADIYFTFNRTGAGTGDFSPYFGETLNLGTTSIRWQHLFLSGDVDMGADGYIKRAGTSYVRLTSTYFDMYKGIGIFNSASDLTNYKGGFFFSTSSGRFRGNDTGGSSWRDICFYDERNAASPIPTFTSGLEQLKKIKTPVMLEKEGLAFDTDAFPKEFQMEIGANKEIHTNLLPVIGMLIKGQQELLERIEKLEQK